ncbi:conserved protein of unknown function, phage related [Ralstonia solanacearum CMR15]|nr:conserved protein of unknown function, phage related [Ralstonia solanacearum CMR15]
MTPQDSKQFAALVGNVYAFYRQDYSVFAGRVWWEAMKPFDFAAVSDAFNRHCVNPDSGQFLPKPADIVRMLQGSTQDAALVAWAKVDRAVRTVGTYRSVVFDDALIHRVVTEMGGWVHIGGQAESEWPFVRNEFVNRYRGYRMRSETPDYPPHLIGTAEASNARAGFEIEPPMLLGDVKKARAVLEGGTSTPLLMVTPASKLAANDALRLVAPRGNA